MIRAPKHLPGETWGTYLREELIPFIKEVAAIALALSVVGGFIVGAWSYFGFWLPLSIQQHSRDILGLRREVELSFKGLRRGILLNRIDTYQGRITVLIRAQHEIEDALLVHKRIVENEAATFTDKEVSRRRISTLTDEQDLFKERLRIAYAELDRMRMMLSMIPYNPEYGDVDETRDPRQ